MDLRSVVFFAGSQGAVSTSSVRWLRCVIPTARLLPSISRDRVGRCLRLRFCRTSLASVCFGVARFSFAGLFVVSLGHGVCRNLSGTKACVAVDCICEEPQPRRLDTAYGRNGVHRHCTLQARRHRVVDKRSQEVARGPTGNDSIHRPSLRESAFGRSHRVPTSTCGL